MECTHCGRDLNISHNEMTSDIDSTDVFSVQTLICTNQNCDIYAGTDSSNPLHIARKLRTKVN